MSERTPTTCAVCGAPKIEYCSACHTPLCSAHVVTRLIIPHCRPCFTRDHQAEKPSAKGERR